MKTLHVLLVLLLALPTLGCQSGAGNGGDEAAASEPGIRSDGFPAPSRASVWEAAMRVLREQQFVPDSDGSAPSAGIATTRWRLSLSPFSRDGYREKATVRVIPVQGRSGYWRTETNVTRQNNNNVSDPSNPLKADWGDPTRNPAMEGLLNRRVEMTFLPNDVSSEFRRHHGMPEAESPRLEGLPQPESDDEFWDRITR